MATKPKQTAIDILADARQVAARARTHTKTFARADAGRRRKLLTPAALRELERAIRECEKAIGQQAVGQRAVAAATRLEVMLRRRLFHALVTIRDDVRLGYPDDRSLARAFGAGASPSPTSTPELLAAASAVTEAYGIVANRRAALETGVTPARITRVATLRAALAAADTSQNTRISVRKGATVAKDAALRDVRRRTAHVRQVARHVFRGNRAVLAQFAPTLARHTPKQRRKSTRKLSLMLIPSSDGPENVPREG